MFKEILLYIFRINKSYLFTLNLPVKVKKVWQNGTFLINKILHGLNHTYVNTLKITNIIHYFNQH